MGNEWVLSVMEIHITEEIAYNNAECNVVPGITITMTGFLNFEYIYLFPANNGVT